MKYLKNTLMALMLVVTSSAAFATTPVPKQDPLFGPLPQLPNLYTDGLTRLQVPNLTRAERSAFSSMEAIQQISEAYIAANGCPTTPLVGDIDIYSDRFGNGDSTVLTKGGTLKVYTKQNSFDSFRGDSYLVTANSGNVGGVNFFGLAGNYRYNKSGSIMEGDIIMSVPNPTASNTPDVFTGRMIKDFYVHKQVYQDVPRDFTLDWGLQVINKKGYPVGKYFQKSWSIKDDGIEGRVHWKKVRIAGGTPCAIHIRASGYNNNEQFNEQGTLTIQPAKLTAQF